MPAGRPSKYDPRYCQEMIDFFAVPLAKKIGNKTEPCELPQMTTFAQKIGVDRSTLDEWKNKHPEFSYAYSHCMRLQESIIAGNAMLNRYNPYFAQFMLKNCHGWRDKTEVEQTTDLKINIDKDESEI